MYRPAGWLWTATTAQTSPSCCCCCYCLQDDPELLVGLLLCHVASHKGLAGAHDLIMLGDILRSLFAAQLSLQHSSRGSSSSRLTGSGGMQLLLVLVQA
jgi:hypothetical protein